MIFLAQIRYDEALVLLEDLNKEIEEIIQTRIVINKMPKEKGSSRECKDALRSEKDEIIIMS